MLSLMTDPLWGRAVPEPRVVIVAACALAFCLGWLGLAAGRHRRNLARIPVRIHVAGTRGKSTITRLVAAALRANGLTVFAKTTGSEPRLIRPDGVEEQFPRMGPASIREQARLIRRAAKGCADAVVVECMAILPEMLWASERHFIRASTLVVTNARPDHFEELGEHDGAQADAFEWVIPLGGNVVIAGEAAAPSFLQRAQTLAAKVTIVDTAGLEPDDANRKLAVAVVGLHGVPATVATAAMEGAAPDPGHFFETSVNVAGKTVRFAGAFACNDVESFARLWSERRSDRRAVILLNARSDRPIRTKHFLAFLARQSPLPFVFIVGDLLAMRMARRTGFPSQACRRLKSSSTNDAMAQLVAEAEPGSWIWGVGNYKGVGGDLIAAFKQVAKSC